MVIKSLEREGDQGPVGALKDKDFHFWSALRSLFIPADTRGIIASNLENLADGYYAANFV